jgi:SAM-dependent methyltransferase
MLARRLAYALGAVRQAARRGEVPHHLRRLPIVGKLRRLNAGRRMLPVSANYGASRGKPIDRYYIDSFLRRFAAHEGYAEGCIRGRILEIGGRTYADRFGHPDARIDVLHVNAENPIATIVGDLTDPGALTPDTYDCVICTQTLPVIWDPPAALRTMHRGLAPGGVLLITVPGITRALLPDRDNWGDWWRFTSSSMRRLCEDVFGPGTVEVESYGNLVSATLFLHGHAAQELYSRELDVRDPNYEVIIGVRARKPGTG